MEFDTAGFALRLLTVNGHAEVLSHACAAAARLSGLPAHAAYLAPGQAWELAVISAGDPAAMSVPAAARSALFAVYRKLALAKQPFEVARTADNEAIFRGLLRDGVAPLQVVPLRTRSGRLAGALVTGRHPEAQAALETIAMLTGPAMDNALLLKAARRDQERMQLFSETTEESLWDWNVVLNEMWFGGNLQQLFGEHVQVSKRHEWRLQRILEEDRDRVVRSFERALNGVESSWAVAYRMHGADGDAIHVREHVYFLREVDGRAYRVIGTVRDMTALQRVLALEQVARAEAEHASAVKDDFLAMLGHELRNPLAPIVSVLTLLERRAEGPDRQLEILRRQTTHLVRLVDDLLDVSRISSGKVELDLRRTSIHLLIQRAVEMVSPLFEQRRHRVDVVDARPLFVDADAARITQVISNVLVNAARYTEPGGHISVHAVQEGRDAVVRVRDSGIGIAPEFMARIFEMFTQGPQGPDRAHGGLGLGLSIVKNLLKLHGGSVVVRSDGIGLGTEVELRLPLANQEVEGSGVAAAPDRRPASPLNLLVIDDNEDAADALCELLMLLGHRVRVVHRPEDALRAFGDVRPDMALVDIGLPGMDGYELVRRMKAQGMATPVRFIAVTGYGTEADKEMALRAGFDAHMVKPVVPDRLEQLIAELADPRDAGEPLGSQPP